jgi:hypothetical protein
VHSYLRNDADAAIHGDRQIATAADSEGPLRMLRLWSVRTEHGTRGVGTAAESRPHGFALKGIFEYDATATDKLELHTSGARRVEMEHARKHDVSIGVLDSNRFAEKFRDFLHGREPCRDAEFESDAESGRNMSTDVAAESHRRSAGACCGAVWRTANCSSALPGALPGKHRAAADIPTSLLGGSSPCSRQRHRQNDYRSSINQELDSIEMLRRFTSTRTCLPVEVDQLRAAGFQGESRPWCGGAAWRDPKRDEGEYELRVTFAFGAVFSGVMGVPVALVAVRGIEPRFRG